MFSLPDSFRRQKLKIWTGLLCLSVLCLLLLIPFAGGSPSLGGVSGQQEVSRPAPGSPEAFEEFTGNLFREILLSDSLNLNYSLADPESFGIPSDTPAAVSSVLPEGAETDSSAEALLEELHSYPFDSLNRDQQITYDILENWLSQELSVQNLTLYDELLGSASGVQAQYPVLLSEYTFRCREDIERYLDYLQLLPGYFQEIVEFEQAKSKAGLFMSDSTAREIIAQCQSFIENPEENLLIETFHSRLEAYDGTDVTSADKAAFRQENSERIRESVIPAYEILIQGLTGLLGTGVHEGGLCQLPEGKAYYTYLLQKNTGSSRSPEELRALITSYLEESLNTMAALLIQSPELASEYQSAAASGTPEAMLSDLRQKIQTDFPPLPATACTVKYVHKSLENYLSPAFYLTPPLDDYTSNVIYINQGSPSSDLYSTLAHEGYPGHLYQNVYFRSQNPNPLREFLGSLGYTEGWATYVEQLSYQYYDGRSQELSSFLAANHMAALAVYSLCDIGIHYDGWTLAQTADFLSGCYSLPGEELARVSEEIYSAIVEDPANYPAYCAGCLEILELKKEQQAALGTGFSLKDFHQKLLEIGPAPFSVIRKYFS